MYHSLVVIDSPHSVSSSSQYQSAAISTLNPMGAAVVSSPAVNSLTNHHTPHFSKIFMNPTWVYKASCSLDGKSYCLFRIEGVHLKQGQGEAAIGQVERWRKIRHPAIVHVREAFTTRAFGDHCTSYVSFLFFSTTAVRSSSPSPYPGSRCVSPR